MAYKVPEGARRWYVRHAENFIEACDGKRLAMVSAVDVASYLDVIGRKHDITI